jgi:hypothetical protein
MDEERWAQWEWWGDRERALACPWCGSNDLHNFDEFDYACRKCGHFFVDTERGGMEMEDLPREMVPINGVPRMPAWRDDAAYNFFKLPGFIAEWPEGKLVDYRLSLSGGSLQAGEPGRF